MFEQKLKKTIKRLAVEGRASVLTTTWLCISIFIIDLKGLQTTMDTFPIIVTRMLDIFSAAGHHQYAKGADCISMNGLVPDVTFVLNRH